MNVATAPLPANALRPWPALSLAEAHATMTAPGSTFEVGQAWIRGVPTRVWRHAPATLREVFAAGRAHGDKTFLVYQDERASFEAFARATLALAEALRKRGIVRGDRVAVAMRNLPEWPVAHFAAVLLGAIAAPLNAWGTGPELVQCLADSGARIAVVDAERWQRIEPLLDQCPALEHVLVSRHAQSLDHPATGRHGGQPTASRLEDLLGGTHDWPELPQRPLPALTLAPDDDATLFYTSGTTGQSKGALGTHRCSVSTILAGAFSVQRNFVRRGEPVPDPAARTTQRALLVAIPLFHTTGCQVILGGALYNGSKLVLMHRWDAEQAFALIERERITQAGGVPTIAWQLIEHPARSRYDLSSLESVAYGGAPAAAELVRRIGETFPQSIPGTGWGMTETSGTFTHHGAEDYRQRPDSAGPPLPTNEIRIAGDDGAELPAGAVGELWVRGPSVVKGYWNRPEETARTFADGWLRTGDLARVDDEGFLYIVDRKKDMLIRGGENIYCTELEAVLYRHPAVVDAGVVGLPHHTLGEEPAALVTLKPGASADEAELRGFVAAQVAAYKVPVRIVVQREPLPRNPAGKLVKNELKRMLAASAPSPEDLLKKDSP